VLPSRTHACSKIHLRCRAFVLLVLLLITALGSPAVQAQAKASSDFASLSTAASAARDANRLGDAIALYKKALALRPNWAEGWWSLGTIQYDTNEYPDAAHSLQKLVALQPKNGMAHAMLGLCQFELGVDDSALRNLEESTELGITADPELRRVLLYHEAVLLQRASKFERSQSLLQQLCLEGTSGAEIEDALGMTLLRMNARIPPAAGSPEQKIVTDLGQAGCLVGQKKYEQAKGILDSLTTEYAQFSNIHYAAGLLLLDTGDTDSAIKQFQAEIRNQPGDVLARLKIAAAEYKVNSQAGILYAEEAVKINPQMPLGHYLLGLLLLDAGDYQRAIPELEIASKAYVNEAKLYFALGSAYALAGRKDDAARARATFRRLNREQQEKPKSTGQETLPGPGTTSGPTSR
jgi:tetratricopeptide (TPR) repeat protein